MRRSKGGSRDQACVCVIECSVPFVCLAVRMCGAHNKSCCVCNEMQSVCKTHLILFLFYPVGFVSQCGGGFKTCFVSFFFFAGWKLEQETLKFFSMRRRLSAAFITVHILAVPFFIDAFFKNQKKLALLYFTLVSDPFFFKHCKSCKSSKWKKTDAAWVALSVGVLFQAGEWIRKDAVACGGTRRGASHLAAFSHLSFYEVVLLSLPLPCLCSSSALRAVVCQR